MLGEIASLINVLDKVFDKLRKLWSWYQARNTPSSGTVTSRFVQLFESHGVHRNQIPRFFGHGITLHDLRNDDALLGKLDETILEAACARFAVRREWLDGADLQAHTCHDFYKEPQDFVTFVETLKKRQS